MKRLMLLPPLKAGRFRSAAPARTHALGLWDTVGIIVGIVVGTSIFVTPPLVFQNVGGPWQALALWLVGGGLSLLGAFCYAELATTYPSGGGDYQYLKKAFGPAVGFTFGWAQLCIVLTGSIGAMAYAFAEYGVALWGLERSAAVWLAVVAVAALSAVNLLGVLVGKTAQNLLSAAKLIGLAAIVAAGLLAGPVEQTASLTVGPAGAGGWPLALVFVLYAYGGWNDAAFVSAEVRDARRNLPRSLFLSIGLVTALYLVVNITFLWVLGFEGSRQSVTPAADVLRHVAGPGAASAISVLVMVTALSAINGLILTGSRLLHAWAADHRLFALLKHSRPGVAAPAGAIVAQGAVALLLIVVVGTVTGQETIDRGLGVIGLGPLPWEQYHGGFETLVAAAAPVFWLFFLLAGVSLFVLRARDKDRPRPFAVPCYPLPPLVFCLMCAFMLQASMSYAGGLCLLALVPVTLGLPLYAWSRRLNGQKEAALASQPGA